MNKTNKTAIIVQPVKKLAMEIQESENYDILGIGISAGEFADAAAQVAYRLAYIDYDTGKLRFHDRRTASLTALGYNWKVVNARRGSIVSISDEKGTALSGSLVAIFHDPYSFTKDEVKGLMDMMNEAWFRLTDDN